MAAGRDMVARLVIRLRDLATPGLDRINGVLERIRRSLARIGAVASLGTVLAFAGPIQQAAAFDQSLRDIAITAGATSANVRAEIRGMEAEFNRLAIATGQRATSVVEGAGILIAAGMDRTVVSGLLPTIARVATGANASMNDLARTAFALSSNMRVSTDEMEDTFGSLMRLGMEGRFELRDMARHFSNLTATAENLRVTGREGAISLGAMLQVGLRGAGSADDAAQNLRNFLSAITSTETVGRFREMGVDLEGVMRNARAAGNNPIEAVIEQVRRLTGGNEFLLSRLFPDQQARGFLTPMLNNVEEYLRLVREARAANRGLIEQTQQAQMDGPFRQIEGTFERIAQLGRRLGTALEPAIVAVNNALDRFAGFIAQVDRDFPGLIDSGILWAGALVGVAAALAPFALAGPMGLILLGIAGAALLIIRNWEPIAAFFEGLWGRISGAFQAGWDLIRPIIDAVVEGARTITRILPEGRREGSAGGAPLAPNAQNLFGGRAALGGFPNPEAALPREARVGGEIIVRAAPGTEVVETRSRNPGVTIVAPDRGANMAVP
jgi:TP901 family phage tail tape measure protein